MNIPCLVREKYLELYKELQLDVQCSFLKKGVDVELRTISHEVIKLWADGWEPKYDDKGRLTWDWDKIFKKFSKRCKRVDLSIFHNGTLIGLAIGRVSKSRGVVRLEFIQRSATETKLKGHVLPIVLTYFIALANRLQASYLAIVNPINCDLVEEYRNYGFEYTSPFNRKMDHIMYRKL